MNKKKKCCWSLCEKEAKFSIGNNLNKGTLDMCSACLKKYNIHQDAREDEFIKQGFEKGKEVAKKIFNEEFS